MSAPAVDIARSVPSSTRDPELEVRHGLREAARALRADGVAVPEPAGKLLRPLVAWALAGPEARSGLDRRFWLGALAVQMVHEASLLHDDVLDGASLRRGRPTLAASGGVGAALALGDHYLTGAYRAAAGTGSPAFLDVFIRAVERTVAGEIDQGAARGSRLSPERYHEVVSGKSGELFGAAAALACALTDRGPMDEMVSFGRALGALYQRVDDLLDVCPTEVTGKPPLQDYRQRKWTWVLDVAGLDGFGLDEPTLLDALFLARDGAPSAARACVQRVRADGRALVRWTTERVPGDTVVAHVVDGWFRAVERGVAAREAALGAGASMLLAGETGGTGGTRIVKRRAAPPGDPGRRDRPAAWEVMEMARAVGGPDGWASLFGRHARTFRFAARLFPREHGGLVRGLYAYCRFTDDLVDETDPEVDGERVRGRVEAWKAATRAAFAGEATGVPLLDEVVGEAGRRGVSWRYPDALLAGVAMDLSPAPFADWARLEAYTFGVAGAVGGWMTQLFGLDDPELLDAAHALGHAMQLTNIVRDVGEDLARGRLYLPLHLLEAHGLDRAALEALRLAPRPLPEAYRRVVDAVMARADGWYAHAWPGIRRLPPWFRRPVAVAAEAYRGIQREVRRAGHDNLRRRAHTSFPVKLVLASRGLARAAV